MIMASSVHLLAVFHSHLSWNNQLKWKPTPWQLCYSSLVGFDYLRGLIQPQQFYYSLGILQLGWLPQPK